MQNMIQNMDSLLQERIKRLHFVGIGGVGMSGIAEVLLNQGYDVSGSDLNDNATVKRLAKLGATIYKGHHAKHVENKDVLVYSSAIDDTNPEIIAAREMRLPIVRRAEMLAELMRFRYGIAVAGTHGKTTTTSLVSTLLSQGNLDPTFVIGGQLNSAGANAHLGQSPYFVAEADESDASFLNLKPMMAVVTNIDSDHMSTYQDDFAILKDTFLQFLHHLPFYGLAVLCIDDPTVQALLPKVARPIVTYGFSQGADFQASNFRQSGTTSFFDVNIPGKTTPLKVALSMPGRHNALNALAAIVIAHQLNIAEEAILQGLENFQGIGRRFSHLGDFNLGDAAFTLIDDYGHHPREIKSTLIAAKEAWPTRRIVLVFQPHRYSRTQSLFDDFSLELSKADALLLLDVYSAGEDAIAGASTSDLCRSIRQRGQVEPVYVGEHANLYTQLEQFILPGDVIIMQGAGNIGSLAQELRTRLAS